LKDALCRFYRKSAQNRAEKLGGIFPFVTEAVSKHLYEYMQRVFVIGEFP